MSLRVGAQAPESLPDDPRDMHLRDVERLADLGLRELVLEARTSGSGLRAPRGEDPLTVSSFAVLEREARALVAGVRRGCRCVVVVGEGPISSDVAVVRGSRLERLEHDLLVGADRRRLPRPSPGVERPISPVIARSTFSALAPARRAGRGRPRAITEVALDLADDRRHREAREREPTVGVEAVDRVDEAHAATWLRSSKVSSGPCSGARGAARAAGSARPAPHGRPDRACPDNARTARDPARRGHRPPGRARWGCRTGCWIATLRCRGRILCSRREAALTGTIERTHRLLHLSP